MEIAGNKPSSKSQKCKERKGQRSKQRKTMQRKRVYIPLRDSNDPYFVKRRQEIDEDIKRNNENMTLEEINNLKVYLKIPITTRYSGDLTMFDKDKTHIVEGKEFCEKDIYGDSVRCWYVSTVFGAVEDKQDLINEIAECGCIPTLEEKAKGLFK